MTPGDALRFDGKMPTENIAAMESLEGGAMTPTMLSLLAAIRAHPDEDTPRLAFADAAIEAAGTVECRLCKGEYDEIRGVYGCKACHGFGRVSDGLAQWGEFIRVQVELARASCRECKGEGKYYEDAGPYESGWRKCKCEVSALRRRERELWPAVQPFFRTMGCETVIDPNHYRSGNGARHPWVVVSRGLPSVVRCTLAKWMGGECGQCQGRGHRTLYGDGSGPWTKCQYCVDGRTPGIGPRLAQAWPIERVEVMDKRSLGQNSTGGFRWTNESLNSWGLPPVIFARLSTGPTCILIRDAGESWASRISARDYESEPAARAALSDALLAWARGQAFRARH